jgi:branched-chain amino acid aminotransferase
MNLTWLENAQCRGFDEVILLNERGEVAECTSANIFAAHGNRVVTPPLSSGCLPGITREVLLAEIHAPGIELVEQPLTLGDLESADEVFITSTTRDLLPVFQVEDRQLARGSRTRTTLQEAFSKYVREYIGKYRVARV